MNRAPSTAAALEGVDGEGEDAGLIMHKGWIRFRQVNQFHKDMVDDFGCRNSNAAHALGSK